MENLLERKRRAREQGVSPAVQENPTIAASTSTGNWSEMASAARVLRDIQALFDHAAYEDFEFGMESEFVRALEASIAQDGLKAVEAVASIILKEQAEPRVAREALRWLGHLDDRASHLLRLRLLEVSLRHPSWWMRDGAALGLDAMKARHAIPALTEAIAHEPGRGLRRYMEGVLRRLQQADSSI